jgi:hypothetical protein
MVNFAASVDAKPYLERIKAPVLALYPSGGSIASAEQEAALRDNVASLHVSHLNTSYQMLGMLQPAACASQILSFSSLHDGIVCREVG